MRRLLHITADHPDRYSEKKTEAVRNLIDGADAFAHSVYSINRVNGLGGIKLLDHRSNVSTVVYHAPAYGVLLETYLNRLADWIVEDCRARRLRFDVVHGHKLTIEGLVARRIATALGCPYVCTVRGNTDQKYIELKPEKRSAYVQVAENAAVLMAGSPWIKRYLVRRLSLREDRFVILPTVTKVDSILAPSSERSRFATAFHLARWRMKGMPNLLEAMAIAKQTYPDISLDIIGGGSQRTVNALEQAVRKHGLRDSVTLSGQVPHEKMLETLNQYAAFVLPTLRESFGMVYVEALFSGVPILYSRDRGVDGYFNGQDVGVRCDPLSVPSIARGLKELKSHSPRMKVSIRSLQNAGGFDRFRKSHICRAYQKVLEDVCGVS